MFRPFFKVLALLALILSPISAQASRVSPMIVELEPNGRNSVARIELTNDGQRDTPFEVKMMLGVISEAGELSFTPADDQFLVFPAQSIVEANSQQVFRIQYVGEPDLSQSEIYYMSIQQVPVAFEGQDSQVQVVVNYNVLVNVVPDGAEPRAEVSAIQPAIKDGIPGIELKLSNVGTRYFLAGFAEWQIAATAEDGTEYDMTFTKDEMTRQIGVGVVGSGRARTFFIPTEKPVLADSIQVEVSP
jgi:fimbrial chaperone protein